MSTTKLLLVIEDEALVLAAAVTTLEDGGFEVIVADDGPAAMELIDQRIEEISGIVTDIRLPGGPDGWEIARHARELKPSIAILYSTADSASDFAAYGVPNSLILQKPYASAQLIAGISDLLNRADNGPSS